MTWRFQSRMLAGGITGLTALLTIFVLIALRTTWRRAARAAETQARFAAANALAEVSRAHADAVARRLDAHVRGGRRRCRDF